MATRRRLFAACDDDCDQALVFGYRGTSVTGSPPTRSRPSRVAADRKVRFPYALPHGLCSAMQNMRCLVKVFTCAVILSVAGCTFSDPIASDANSNATLGLEAGDVLVIRQLYGGGGNSGATLKNDFIELFNAGAAPLSLTGLSVQYAPSKQSFGTSKATISELPDALLAPGQSFLIQAAQGSAGTVELPTADLSDDTPIAMSASAGRVALVQGTSGLDCGALAQPCAAEALARIIDLVGYGAGSTQSEGNPLPTLSAKTAALRRRGGCQDSNDNSADFEVADPAPRNSSSPLVPCGDAVEPQPAPETDAGTPITDDPGMPGALRIHDIQGAAHRSPLASAQVSKLEGIVTALSPTGFWFQDPTADDDPATSEGLFVYTANASIGINVRIGDRVYVSGRVTEFRPACASCSPSSNAFDNLTITELTNVSDLLVVAVGETLPEPVRIGMSGRMPPLTRLQADTSGDDANRDVETNGAAFDVIHNGLDFHESLEGMRIAFDDAVASGPTYDFRTSQEVTVSIPGARSRLSARGGLLLGEVGHGDDRQPERFHVSSMLTGYESFPQLDVGDRFDGELVGVVDYAFGKFLVLATTLPTVVKGGLVRETIDLPIAKARSLDVATFNLENLGGDAEQQRFDAMAQVVVGNLGSPDLLVLEEVQDDNGAANDSVTRSTLTIARLTQAISNAAGPRYEYRDIAPEDDQDGGQPGGNIRVGILFRTDRGLSFVDRAGGGATTSTTVTDQNGVPQLSASPGRIAPSDTAFANSRKPLVAELSFAGEPLFVVGNHWNSKGGDDPTFGRFQPPVRSSEMQRRAQAELVTQFVEQILAIDANANVLVLGDLNDFRHSDAVSLLVDRAKLSHLIDTLPENERYGYVYQGVSQLLNHVLTSQAMAARLVGFDVVHINAEFADQLSDHDPSVARFAFAEPSPGDTDMPPDSPVVDAGPVDDGTMRDDAGAGSGGDAAAGAGDSPDAASMSPVEPVEPVADGSAGDGPDTETDTDPITSVPGSVDEGSRGGCSLSLRGSEGATNSLGSYGLLLAAFTLLARRRQLR